MTSIKKAIKNLFTKVEPLHPGAYHYSSPPEAEHPYRLHLRVEPDGTGLMIVNASTILHLNQTAVEYAYHYVMDHSNEEIAETMASRYPITKKQALIDFSDFKHRVWTLIDMPDLDPVMYLDFERQQPYSENISAPYRLDCALTYKLREGSDPASAPIKRVDRELSTDEWKSIIQKAWDAGIPHLIFTGGEPTLREDLLELILYAEGLGQVTGLMTDGMKLIDHQYLEAFLQTGVDHLLITLDPDSEQSWEVVKTVIPEDIFTTVHLTITDKNQASTSEFIDRLGSLEINALSISAETNALEHALMQASERASENHIELVWDIPVPYSQNNPISIETEEDNTPEGAGKGWLYVEPDGDVLPSQEVNRVLGNLLDDTWESIWQTE